MRENLALFENVFQSERNIHDFINRHEIPGTWAEDEIIFSCGKMLGLNLFLLSSSNNITHPFTKYIFDEFNEHNMNKSLLIGYIPQTHFQSLILTSELPSIHSSDTYQMHNEDQNLFLSRVQQENRNVDLKQIEKQQDNLSKKCKSQKIKTTNDNNSLLACNDLLPISLKRKRPLKRVSFFSNVLD